MLNIVKISRKIKKKFSLKEHYKIFAQMYFIGSPTFPSGCYTLRDKPNIILREIKALDGREKEEYIWQLTRYEIFKDKTTEKSNSASLVIYKLIFSKDKAIYFTSARVRSV